MTTTKWWTAGAVVLMLVIMALGWVLGVEPRLTEARAADDERAGVQELNASYERTLVTLQELNENLPELKNQRDELRAALPTDAEVATLLGQLNELAADNSVALNSITAGVPAAFELAETVAAPVTPAPVEGEEPVAGEAVAAATPATEIPANFVSVPITVIAKGDAAQVLEFVESVQYGTRLFFVDALTVTYDGSGGEVTIDGFVFVLTEDAPAADTEETVPAEGD